MIRRIVAGSQPEEQLDLSCRDPRDPKDQIWVWERRMELEQELKNIESELDSNILNIRYEGQTTEERRKEKQKRAREICMLIKVLDDFKRRGRS